MQPLASPIGLAATLAARRAARNAALVCGSAAVAAVAAGTLLGQPLMGVALGLGLLLSALNAMLARWLLRLGAAFAATSLLRLMLFTLLALATYPLLGTRVVLVAVGLAAGQLVLSAASAREVLRRS